MYCFTMPIRVSTARSSLRIISLTLSKLLACFSSSAFSALRAVILPLIAAFAETTRELTRSCCCSLNSYCAFFLASLVGARTSREETCESMLFSVRDDRPNISDTLGKAAGGGGGTATGAAGTSSLTLATLCDALRAARAARPWCLSDGKIVAEDLQ